MKHIYACLLLFLLKSSLKQREKEDEWSDGISTQSHKNNSEMDNI